MASISTIIAAIGVGTGVVGTVIQYQGMKKAEEAKKKAADLEAKRARREQLRQVQIARAQALSQSVSSNASLGSSVQGGMGSASSQGAYNIQGINQGQEIGAQITQGNQQANLGATIGSLGGAIVQSSNIFGKIGTYALGIKNA